MQFLICGLVCWWFGFAVGYYNPERNDLAGVLTVVACIATAIALLVILTAGGKAVLF